MSSGGSYGEEEEATEVIFEAEYESSEEPPREQWSSLIFEIPETNRKKLEYETGTYHPGSGELCAKYVAISDSRILKHPFFSYPAVTDPGIKVALLKPEPPIIYPDDGQELYLVVCKEMGQCPVRKFHKGLLEEVINLRYYCVDPRGVRAMAMALKYNRIVKVLNLMDNFLSDDACYHLGEMLMTNSSIREINLSGCRIGPEGTNRLFRGLPINRALKEVNLNKNRLGDVGVEYIAKAVFQGLDVQKIHLNSNNIGAKAANILSEAFETHSKFITLDLSWNNLYSPGGTFNLLSKLGESKALQELDMSWNSMTGARIGTGIKNLMKAPNLKYLNLSNNRLSGEAIANFTGILTKTKKLLTLDLSFNPLTPLDAFSLLEKMKLPAVKIQKLYMENVFVNGAFLELLERVQQLKFRKNFVVTYGGVISGFAPVGPDMRELVLNRAEFLAKKPKKRPVDIALVAQQLLKDQNIIMPAKEFTTAIQACGAPLDDNLIDEIVNVFSGPRTPKAKTIDLRLLVEYMQRKWPERKLPPTPPPELEPVLAPEPVVKDKKEKGKGKK